MIVYTVLAQRWGDEEGHHYICGVFTNKEHAENCGFAEKNYRGGKYECKIEEFEIIEEDITEAFETYQGATPRWARAYID